MAQNVAVVHDWLTGMRGGEKVLEAILELFPDAPIYTLLHVRGSVSPGIERHHIHTSLLQHLPRASSKYRQYLPIFPTLVELFDLDRYDLIISTSHCAAKSIVPTGRATHLCYCHSPMRYAWDQFPAYFGPEAVGRLRSRLLRPILASLARWDRATAGRVDLFVANSQYVAGRIRRYYNRGSVVVYPPVDTEYYTPAPGGRRDNGGFLLVSALVPYKRVDVAITACRAAGRPLTIIGQGPEEPRLRSLAGPGVTFLGWCSDDDVRTAYRQARAVLMPGIEDFGLVPVEAQSCGTPVIAVAAGGACETVMDGVTGVLAADATPESLCTAISRLESLPLDPGVVRDNALRFSRDRFMTDFRRTLSEIDVLREKRPCRP